MRSVPLLPSCLGPVRRLASLGGGGGGPYLPVPDFWSYAPFRTDLCIWGGPAPGGAGGWGGRPVCPLPWGLAGGLRGAEGHSTSVRPTAFPSRARKRVSLASLRSCRAWPPYCCSSCPRADAGCGPRAAIVRSVRLLVVVTAGAGRWHRGGVWRTGLTAFPLGGGVAPWFLAAPLRFPSLDPRQLPEGGLYVPAQAPLWLAAWRHAPLPAACAAGAARAPGAVWLAAVASVRWGGGRLVRRRSSGTQLGGPGGRGAGGRSASVRPSPSPGRASKRAAPALPSPWRAWAPYCTGSRPRAAARTRSAGCPCAPAQGCWPAAVTVGVRGRQTGGAGRTGPVAPLPGCRGHLGKGGLACPFGGLQGRCPPGRPLANDGFRGQRREGGRGGGPPHCSPPVPRCLSLVAAGGRPDSLGPGGSAVDEGGGGVGLGWVKASPGRPPTVRAAFPAGPDWAAVPGCPVTRATGLLTAP